MSYVTSYYHVVFTTKNRQPVITHSYRNNLYSVIASLIAKHGCKALIINGIHDHIHILLKLHPSVALASLIRDVKSQSSIWATQSGYFPMFKGWGHEYSAFSTSQSHRQAVYDYISNQESHHGMESFETEFKRLVLKNGLVFYPWENPDGKD